MLKCCVRPLITLVLVLVAAGALSTLGHARTASSPQAAPVLRASTAPMPGANGEPDTPQSPPPVRLNGGITSPTSPLAQDPSAGLDYWAILRWTGWVWAFWFARSTL